MPADFHNLARAGNDYLFSFRAMATPCEVRIETDDPGIAQLAGSVVQMEAARIEQKFSRYRDDNITWQINKGDGRPVKVDEETGLLLTFADEVFYLSDGLFDITSGILRKVWRFDGSGHVPRRSEITTLLPYVGWQKVDWRKPFIRLAPGMEIDLGGIAKEYAVDRALKLAREVCLDPMLINFGGDLAVSGPRQCGAAWNVAIEAVDELAAAAMLELRHGAIATSGDAKRYLEKDGIRYGHIINPLTGWPVREPLRSVSVAATTCLEAGMTATMAILKGVDGAKFLRDERAKAWVIR